MPTKEKASLNHSSLRSGPNLRLLLMNLAPYFTPLPSAAGREEEADNCLDAEECLRDPRQQPLEFQARICGDQADAILTCFGHGGVVH